MPLPITQPLPRACKLLLNSLWTGVQTLGGGWGRRQFVCSWGARGRRLDLSIELPPTFDFKPPPSCPARCGHCVVLGFERSSLCPGFKSQVCPPPCHETLSKSLLLSVLILSSLTAIPVPPCRIRVRLRLRGEPCLRQQRKILNSPSVAWGKQVLHVYRHNVRQTRREAASPPHSS